MGTPQAPLILGSITGIHSTFSINAKTGMKMKRQIISLGLIAAAVLSFAGCAKENVETVGANVTASEAVPFELTLNLATTKTMIDDQFKVSWSEGDAISVFHAEAGTTAYVNDGKFTVAAAGATGTFTGTLASSLEEGKTYDWYVVYPYNELTTSPETAVFKWNTGQEAPSNGTIENLNSQKLPLWSNIKALKASEAPAFQMHHVYSIAKVTMKNVNVLTMSVGNFSIDGSKNNSIFTKTSGMKLGGDVQFNLTGEKVVAGVYTGEGSYNPDHSTVNFDMSWGNKIKKGDSWTIYFPIIPQELPAESSLFITPNNFGYGAGKFISFLEPFEFKPGVITDFNITLDKDEMYLTESQIADTVRFRFCYDRDNMAVKFLGSDGWWHKKKSPKFFCNYDHVSAIKEFDESEESAKWYWKSYLSATKQSDVGNVKFEANANRYYLATAKMAKDQNLSVYLNAANIAAGKKVVFHTSFFMASATSCQSYKCEYSVDGGTSFLPATVAVEAPVDKVDGDVVTFATTESYKCHPLVISTDALAAAVEKGTVVIRMTLLEENNAQHVGFAPYYKYDGELKSFVSKIEGPYTNIEGCAYITVE